MSRAKTYKTDYKGVSYIILADPATGKPERRYRIRYRTKRADGTWQLHHEMVGRQFLNNMTPAKASGIRARRIHGDEKSNRDRRAEAEAAKRALKEKWTVAGLWEEYRKANPDLKGMSVYVAIFNAYLKKSFGNKEPTEITPFDIDRLKLKGMKGKSPKSVSNTLELLRRIVNFGIKRQLCAGPGFTIQLPPVNNIKTEDLTKAQLSRLIHVVDKHIELKTSYADAATMMKLVLLTGMRRGEIFRLKWSDLDFNRDNILLREPKGGSDVVIPMSSFAKLLLKGVDQSESEYVFPGKGGEQRRDVRKQINPLKLEADLPNDFRPLHGLRHVFASGLVSNGTEFHIVQRLLTHKGGTVTHRYAHIRDDALRQSAELAGKLVEQATAKPVVQQLKKG